MTYYFIIRGAYMEAEKIRINKYLSQCGVCSRREADRMLDDGRIRIGGRTAAKGDLVSPGEEVTVDGTRIEQTGQEIVIAFHKPKGIVCTSSKKDRAVNIIEYIDFPERIYPVGRLDKGSTGLILLTNNGQLMDDILRGSNAHEKEYVVTINRDLTPSICQAMEQGVPILGTMTRPCRITHRQGRQFHITLTQGLNRQIRRMCEYFGYRVYKLERIRIMNIKLGDLPEGKWRYLSEDELRCLKEMCRKKRSQESERDRKGTEPYPHEGTGEDTE